jgi:hypothetical protein
LLIFFFVIDFLASLFILDLLSSIQTYSRMIGPAFNGSASPQVHIFLVIYNFHWSDHTGTIRHIRELYLPYLRRWLKYPFDVVFYAPKAFPDLGIASNNLSDNGFYSPYTFTVAYRNRSRNYAGYIFLNDDSILDPILFNKHNLSKIAVEDSKLMHELDRYNNWYWIEHLPGRIGWRTLQDWFQEVCGSKFSYLPMCKTYQRGDHYYGYADFFYIPHAYAETVADLAEICAHKHVFLEMCVPTIAGNFPFIAIGRFESRYNWSVALYGRIPYFHPVKLSVARNIADLQQFITITSENELQRLANLTSKGEQAAA